MLYLFLNNVYVSRLITRQEKRAIIMQMETPLHWSVACILFQAPKTFFLVLLASMNWKLHKNEQLTFEGCPFKELSLSMFKIYTATKNKSCSLRPLSQKGLNFQRNRWRMDRSTSQIECTTVNQILFIRGFLIFLQLFAKWLICGFMKLAKFLSKPCVKCIKQQLVYSNLKICRTETLFYKVFMFTKYKP